MVNIMMAYITGSKWRFALAILLATGTILTGIGLMTSSGYLISRAAQRPMIVDLFMVTAAVRFFGISRAVVRYLDRLVSHDLTFRILRSMRKSLYNKLNTFSQKWLMGQRPGDMLSLIITDIETLQNIYLRLFSPAIVALTISLLTFTGIAFFDLRLASMILLFLLLNGTLIPFLFYLFSRGRGKLEVSARSSLKVFLVDRLQGIQEIIWMGQKNNARLEFNQMQNRLDQVQHQNAGTSGMAEAVNGLMAHLAMFATLLMGIQLISSGEIKGVWLAALTMGVLSSFEAVQGLANAFIHGEASAEAANRLISIGGSDHGATAASSVSKPSPTFPHVTETSATDRKQPVAHHPSKTGKISCRQPIIHSDTAGKTKEPATHTRSDAERLLREGCFNGLAFNNVSFSYDEENIALDNISFSIPPLCKTAIVGPTGSGKSTLVNLLLGFWHPDQGTIEAGGINTRNTNLEVFRSMFGVVSQDAHIFNRSLRDNLLLANPAATDCQISGVLKTVGMSSFAADIDMQAGNLGMRFSGGERQLFAIARLLLKDAPVWIFDEPTANLDVNTERTVLNTIWDQCGKRTLVIITHRLIDMGKMDQVIVMERGRIVEKGTHEELQAANALYARMYRDQLQLIRE